jgi:hypothetical protein
MQPNGPLEKRLWCPLDRRLGGPLSRSGRRGVNQNLLPLPELILSRSACSPSLYRLSYHGPLWDNVLCWNVNYMLDALLSFRTEHFVFRCERCYDTNPYPNYILWVVFLLIRRTSEFLHGSCLAILTHEDNQFRFNKSKNILDKSLLNLLERCWNDVLWLRKL